MLRANHRALILLGVLCVLVTGYSQAGTTSHNTYFSAENEFGGPVEEASQEFDCSDKIFTVVELGSYPLGEHQLSVRWMDPFSTMREHTQYPFHIHQTDSKIWAWLNLFRARGAGLLQWVDPAAGMTEFIGEWSVEVRVDNKLLEEKKFTVIC